jgi:hydrogenase maturation protein HypF
VRGLGGVHLACDARDDGAVARLRKAKQRADKPLAVMFEDAAAAAGACRVDGVAGAALEGPERPIVLLPRTPASALAAGIAPGLDEVGAFLPGTGLHHLLLRAFGGPLVMTSGNLSDEPIAVTNDEARLRLGHLCDLLLLNDRDIAGRADDSVVRVIAGASRVQRRAKGYAAGPFPLGFRAPDVLAVGADLKNTLCVTRGAEAFLSPHVGDLGSLDAQRAWDDTRVRMERLFGVRPAAAAHDLHPEYHGTGIAARSGLPALPVQHHHAHVASCLVENGFAGPVIGIAWDGTGYGTDGTVWGGEILAADLSGFTRLGRLRPVALAGGDAAVQEGWRMAVAHLMDTGLDPARVEVRGSRSVARMIETGSGTVPTSSMGRLFDAVASLCGVRHASSYEGQAAQELEALAGDGHEAYPMALMDHGSLLEMDARPLVRAVVADVDAGATPAVIAARFHAGLAAALAAACRTARERTGLRTVALTGGCFANRRLTELAVAGLRAEGFEVLLHARVPPGDGGIALGQAAVAAWRLAHVPGHSR